MTVRCRLSTSSYFRTFLRISKLLRLDLGLRRWRWSGETIFDSSGTSSGKARDKMASVAAAALNRRIRSSVIDR